MGWDITYHPIRMDELRRCYFDLLSERGDFDDVISRYKIPEPHQERYRRVLTHARGFKQGQSFNRSHGYCLAIVQGLLRKYFYIRGGAFSFALSENQNLARYCLDLSELLPPELQEFPVDFGLLENYSCGVFLHPGRLKRFREDLETDVDLQSEMFLVFSDGRLEIFKRAMQFAIENNCGLLEASEVIIPNPLNLNRSRCFSNLHNCDAEGALLYQQAATKQLALVQEK